MAKPLFTVRKRRTRAHVIADLSVNHVEGFILNEGHTAQRLGSDYGYDLVLFTHDEQGYLEPGAIYIQLKASDNIESRVGASASQALLIVEETASHSVLEGFTVDLTRHGRTAINVDATDVIVRDVSKGDK